MLRDLLLYLSDRFRALIAGVWNLLRFSYSLHTILFFVYCSSTANYNLHIFCFSAPTQYREVNGSFRNFTNTHKHTLLRNHLWGLLLTTWRSERSFSYISLSRSCINHCALLRAKTDCNAFYRKLFFFVLLCGYTHHLTHGFDFLKMKWKKLDEHYLSRIDSLSISLSRDLISQ